jgi:hypothetical protein
MPTLQDPSGLNRAPPSGRAAWAALRRVLPERETAWAFAALLAALVVCADLAASV